MKNKRILFINSCLSDGGAERVMVALANEFCKRGNYVKMILIRPQKADTYHLDENIECERYKYVSDNKIIKSVIRVSRFRREMKKGGYDYIVAFPRVIAYPTLVAAWGLKTKIIVSERNDPTKRLENPFRRFVELTLYKKAYRVVFQTPDVMNMYPQNIKNKAVVIVNPIHEGIPQKYSGIRKKAIVAVGRIDYQKNYPMLIGAFEKLHREKEEYELFIYGQGKLMEEMKALSDELGIKDSVHFEGYVSDVTDRMNTCEMYVSSSDYEGISNTMIEAMAMGLPAICTDCPVGGARLMIENGTNGVLVPVRDIDNLYEAMLRLASSEQLRDNLSNEAVKIRDKYSIDKITDKWEELMK